MTTPHTALIEELRSCFPAHLRERVESTVQTMECDRKYGFSFRDKPTFVLIGDERLRLPRRHAALGSAHSWGMSPNNAIEAAIAATHHDGFVRQRSVRPLLLSRELWTIPYVLELASDYVIEILIELDDHLHEVDDGNLRQYIAQNPVHLSYVTARIISYWNAYYRSPSEERALSSYPGFRILSFLEARATHPPQLGSGSGRVRPA